MPKAFKVSTDKLGRAMKEFEGDYEKVADYLGCSVYYARERVRTDPKLRPIWISNGTARINYAEWAK